MPTPKDYKKDQKPLYQPKTTPAIVEVEEMQFVAVEGRGDPNDENGEYQSAIEVLYGIQYAIKMSKKGNNVPKGYFDYVVPPLEGFWWLENEAGFTLENKSKYCWVSLIRLPEFVDESVFEWAWHHEIYLSDPRKTEISNLKTVLRVPVKRIRR